MEWFAVIWNRHLRVFYSFDEHHVDFSLYRILDSEEKSRLFVCVYLGIDAPGFMHDALFEIM